MQETQVRSPDQGDPLEKEMATHSSTLAWKIPWRSLVGYSPWGCKESDMTVTSLSFFLSMTQNPWASNSTSCAILLLLFSCQVMSDSLRLHGLQHTRLPCPSPSLAVWSNLGPLSHLPYSFYIFIFFDKRTPWLNQSGKPVSKQMAQLLWCLWWDLSKPLTDW